MAMIVAIIVAMIVAMIVVLIVAMTVVMTLAMIVAMIVAMSVAMIVDNTCLIHFYKRVGATYMSIAFTSFFMTFGAGFDHPQSPTLYKGNLRKYKGISCRSVFLAFSAITSIKRLVTGIVLHSWGPDASFDTHGAHG